MHWVFTYDKNRKDGCRQRMLLQIAKTLIIAVFHLTDHYRFIYLQLPLQASDLSSITLMNVVWIWANGGVLEGGNLQHPYETVRKYS